MGLHTYPSTPKLTYAFKLIVMHFPQCAQMGTTKHLNCECLLVYVQLSDREANYMVTFETMTLIPGSRVDVCSDGKCYVCPLKRK